LLARLSETEVPESNQGFANRLGHWLDWTDAISLSAALGGGVNGRTSAAAASPVPHAREELECVRVRKSLTKAIVDDMQVPPSDAAPDFAAVRWLVVARQQAMSSSIGALRALLRARVAARSPAMAQLAAVDAVMEHALGAHERALLAKIPALLQSRFERERRAHSLNLDKPHADAPPERWLEVFCKDVRDVLLAELDFRLQPVEGLLGALRMR
jgi:hypothetical protein